VAVVFEIGRKLLMLSRFLQLVADVKVADDLLVKIGENSTVWSTIDPLNQISVIFENHLPLSLQIGYF